MNTGSSSLSSVELKAYFECLPANGRSESELSQLRLKLEDEAKSIKKSFANLVCSLQRHIHKTYKVVEYLKISKFFPSDFEESLSYCKDIYEMFGKLSSNFSFFNLDIIKVLTARFGSETNKKKLKKYRKKFRDYSKRRLCECPSDAFGDKEMSEENRYVLKIDKSMILTPLKNWKFYNII